MAPLPPPLPQHLALPMLSPPAQPPPRQDQTAPTPPKLPYARRSFPSLRCRTTIRQRFCRFLRRLPLLRHLNLPPVLINAGSPQTRAGHCALSLRREKMRHRVRYRLLTVAMSLLGLPHQLGEHVLLERTERTVCGECHESLSCLFRRRSALGSWQRMCAVSCLALQQARTQGKYALATRSVAAGRDKVG